MNHVKAKSNLTTNMLLTFFLVAFTICGFSFGFAIGINQGQEMCKSNTEKFSDPAVKKTFPYLFESKVRFESADRRQLGEK